MRYADNILSKQCDVNLMCIFTEPNLAPVQAHNQNSYSALSRYRSLCCVSINDVAHRGQTILFIFHLSEMK